MTSQVHVPFQLLWYPEFDGDRVLAGTDGVPNRLTDGVLPVLGRAPPIGMRADGVQSGQRVRGLPPVVG
jgi:hypothetical protein